MFTLLTLCALLVFAIIAGVIKFVVRRAVWLKTRRDKLTPYERGQKRAIEAAFLLVACVYAATWFPVFVGHSFGELFVAFCGAPLDHLGIAFFIAIVVLGLAWIAAGWRDARGGDRDPVKAGWSGLVAGGCLGLLWWHWYPSPDRDIGTLYEMAFLKGLYIAVFVAALLRAWLCVPIGGNALRAIKRSMAKRNAPLRPARPR